MKDLIPLQQSAEYDQLEAELKALVISLWQKNLADRALDVSLHGMPHLGSKDLILKTLKQDGIANFNTINLTEDNARYLLMAFHHCNQKKGTHFLETFLKCTWGNDFEIHQLWQKKDVEYPKALKTEQEISDEGLDGNDYFLTSRLRIELGNSGTVFPSDIAKTLRSTLQAKLFVADILRRTNLLTTYAFGDLTEVASISTGSSKVEIEEIESIQKFAYGHVGQAQSITTGSN